MVFHCCVKRKSLSDAGNGMATVFQKCQIPRVYSLSSQPPAGVKTSPALESRDTVFLFLFIFSLSSTVPGSYSSSSGPGCACYPDCELMFRFGVASSALQCVTDPEDTQLATGEGECGDVKQTRSVCLPVCSASSILCTPTQCSHVYMRLSKPAFGCAFTGRARTSSARPD